jgi:arylformamidase
MFRVLSYIMRPGDPVWPGNLPVVRTEATSSIAQGADANTAALHLFGHSGTHLDAPKHFNDTAASAYQLSIENYIFFQPLVVDVPKAGGSAILQAELEPYAQQLEMADLVMLRTGWSAMRTQDPARYPTEGPYLHPDGARWLMRYPNLKGVAIDTVSIGAPYHPQHAVETHRILTGVGREDGRFLLILEDLRIDADLGSASRIYAWPLLIEGTDSSPCTIVAEFAE